MKTIVLLFLIICSINLSGQEKLKIEINNPEPRVGERVLLTLNIDFLMDYLNNELGENIDFTRSTSIFGIQSDDFERDIVFNKAKTYRIGPFDFEFNGKLYTTNDFEVNVLPELSIEKGLWLRYVEFEGQKYLILEQIISNEPSGKEFAELNDILTDGIKLINYLSSTNTVNPKGAGPFDVGFSKSIKTYGIEFDENFKGFYIVSKMDFKNLPETYDIGRIELKK